MLATAFLSAAGLFALAAADPLAAELAPVHAGSPPYEVWAVDQSGDAGILHIYYGRELEHRGARAKAEVVDLAAVVAPLCLAQTGTAPVRAHSRSTASRTAP